MQSFSIVKQNENKKESYRVARIKADFDVNFNYSSEKFEGQIKIPDSWHIGVIVGASGTGKTTIAKELFNDIFVTDFEYKNDSVIDDMPSVSVDKIEQMFYTVGFSSVPSWLKPYHVLSNGEKMRVDLARALLTNDSVLFDEFTSVVDRNVARTMSIALEKAVRKMNKQFIAVTCHYDVLNWLQPDWVFDTTTMKNFFMTSHGSEKSIKFMNAIVANGKSLGSIII